MSGFYWLASYPKSGSTWLALALGSIYRGGRPVDFMDEAIGFPQAAARDAFDRTLGIESSDLTPEEDERLRPQFYEMLAKEAREPLLRRVHSAFVHTADGDPLFPPKLTRGVVYLVRDPRDVAVSYAHYMNTTVAATIASMRNSEAVMGPRHGTISPLLNQRLLTWSDHVQSWLHSGLRQLLIRYEDMLMQPQDVLAAVSSFLEWNVDPTAIAAAVEATRFDRLRSEEEEHGYESGASRPFFRSGHAGGWRAGLSADQVQEIERDHERMMIQLGYELTT